MNTAFAYDDDQVDTGHSTGMCYRLWLVTTVLTDGRQTNRVWYCSFATTNGFARYGDRHLYTALIQKSAPDGL